MRQAVQLLAELSRHSLPAVMGMLLLLLASPFLNWATVMLTKHFIDSLTGEELRMMLALAAGMGAVAVAIALVGRLQSFVGDKLTLDMTYRMEHYLLAMLKPVTVTQLETPQFQQDLNILKNSLFKINSFIQSGLSFCHQIILIAVYTWMLIPYSVLASIIVFCCSLTALLQVWMQTTRQEKLFQTVSQNEMEARHLSELVLQPAAQKEMLVFSAGAYLKEKWKRAAHAVLQVKKQFLNKMLVWEMFVELVQPLGFFLIQLVLLPKVAGKQMTVGEYVAISAAAGYLAASWKTFFHSVAPFKGLQLFLQRFFRFRDTYFPQEGEGRKQVGKLQRVELRGLQFTYPAAAEPVLNRIHIQMQRGEMIALIGENGSGKSTLAKVLAGLHDVERGQMFVNGKEICELDRASFYSRVAIVNQDYMRYPFSVYENIALASPSAEDADRMDSFLRQFPELVPAQLQGRLETLIGYQYLNAKQLSGGQWQRIALARALYKQADLLVLDEATAELDPAVELPLIDRLRELRREGMTVLVTHNMHVARRADRIFVLRDGTIAEAGSHEQLLAERGLYHKMWKQQNESLKKGDAKHVFA